MPGQQMLYLKTLIEILKKINSSLDIGEILKTIVEDTTKILNTKGCTIFLLDQARKKLLVGSSYGLSEEYIKKGPVDSEKSIVDTLSGKWVAIPNASKDHRIQYCKEAKQEGVASILSIPLSVKGTVIGVMRIYTTQQRNFSDIENEFIAGLAEIGSIGIENARIYEHLKTEHEKLIYDVHQWFDSGPTR